MNERCVAIILLHNSRMYIVSLSA